jgi:hypothetical protein
MPNPRIPGRLGRKPGVRPVGLRDLTYYVPGDLPLAPPALPVPEVGEWGMLGNDRYGDCGVAGLQHVFMADASILEEGESFPDAAKVIGYYMTYTDHVDSGVALAPFLAYVRQQGYFGHSVDAYAPVGVRDIPTLRTVTWMYGAAYCGIVVTEGMQRAFASHQPWTTDDLLSNVIGGHCVPVVGYDDSYLYVVTWGEVQAVSYAAWHYISDEAWAIITGEQVAAHSDGRGVSLDALRADLDRITNVPDLSP